jgi:hypothetical protein
MIDAVIRALGVALAMGWEILWPLILGFALSAVVQANYTTWLNLAFLVLAGLAFTQNRRPSDAAHDEQANLIASEALSSRCSGSRRNWRVRHRKT